MLLRALILVPTADLAYQVKKVFEQFNEGSGLKVTILKSVIYGLGTDLNLHY